MGAVIYSVGVAMRKVFYSFHYEKDSWRTNQVRNIGVVEGNEPVSGNEWESIKGSGNAKIEEWINSQLEGRSCIIVLIGAETANRKWINYEIRQAWHRKMGMIGICIDGLEDQHGNTSRKGRNPFEDITFEGSQKKLSEVVQCFNPTGQNSKERYSCISDNLAKWVEAAIKQRG